MKYEFDEMSLEDRRYIPGIATWASTDAIDTISKMHSEQKRCAIVIFFTPGEERGFCMDAEAAMQMFPFEPIKEALNFYKPGKSICIIIVRKNKVAVTVTGTL